MCDVYSSSHVCVLHLCAPQALKLKKRQLSLQSGAKSREKVVVVDGCTLQEVHRALMAAQDR